MLKLGNQQTDEEEAEEGLNDVETTTEPVAGDGIEDASLEEWLGDDESNRIGHSVVRFSDGKLRRLAIAALTEGEIHNLVISARNRKTGKTDIEMSKLMQVCWSLNKANGKIGPGGVFMPGAVVPNKLKEKLGGSVTTIYQDIAALSNFEQQGGASDQARAFFD